MPKKIAVEDGLNDLGYFLKTQGYEVVRPGESPDVSAIIVTGQHTNMLGIEDTTTRVPVIDVTGYTTDEILFRIRELP